MHESMESKKGFAITFVVENNLRVSIEVKIQNYR